MPKSFLQVGKCRPGQEKSPDSTVPAATKSSKADLGMRTCRPIWTDLMPRSATGRRALRRRFQQFGRLPNTQHLLHRFVSFPATRRRRVLSCLVSTSKSGHYR